MRHRNDDLGCGNLWKTADSGDADVRRSRLPKGFERSHRSAHTLAESNKFLQHLGREIIGPFPSEDESEKHEGNE